MVLEELMNIASKHGSVVLVELIKEVIACNKEMEENLRDPHFQISSYIAPPPSFKNLIGPDLTNELVEVTRKIVLKINEEQH